MRAVHSSLAAASKFMRKWTFQCYKYDILCFSSEFDHSIDWKNAVSCCSVVVWIGQTMFVPLFSWTLPCKGYAVLQYCPEEGYSVTWGDINIFCCFGYKAVLAMVLSLFVCRFGVIYPSGHLHLLFWSSSRILIDKEKNTKLRWMSTKSVWERFVSHKNVALRQLSPLILL